MIELTSKNKSKCSYDAVFFFIGFGCIEQIYCSLIITISQSDEADYTEGIDVISVRENVLNYIRNIRETIKTFTTANYSLSISYQAKYL